jgi:hypothetical protein
MNKNKLFQGLLFIAIGFITSCKTDDVKPFVTLKSDVTSITENAGTATITASILVASQNDIAVTLDTIGSTAKGDGIDFTLNPAIIIIPAGSLSGSAQLTAVPDNLKQGNQTVTITIKSIVGGNSNDNQKLTITIMDDDIPPKKPYLLVEDFDYPAGDALTLHGWAIHSATTNPLVVTSPGLTFAGYVGSGIGNAAGVNNTGIDENKPFGAQTTAGSIYASFLVNATATSVAGDYFFNIFDPNAVTSHRGRVFILPVSGAPDKMTIGFAFGTSPAQTTMSTPLNFGQTYLMVVKYTIVDGATNDNVSLYVFAQGDDFTNEPATPTLGPLTGAVADIVPTGVALRQFDAAQRITVDGIRVNTEWNLKP